MISHDCNLSLLSYAVEARGELYPALPSWVPDWSTQQRSVGQRQNIKTLAQYGVYNESGSLTTDIQYMNDGQILVVSDILIDILPTETDAENNTVSCTRRKKRKRFHSFETPRGYSVRTIGHAIAGDQLWVLDGESTAFVLRPNSDAFTLICGAVILDMGNEVRLRASIGDQVSQWSDIGEKSRICIC
jgi:hypothetical protein